MSRENTSPLPHGDGEGRCLTSSPCAALLWSVALRGGSRSLSCCVLRAVPERLQAAWRQCANHGSIGDSRPMALLGCPRGHTVAHETGCLTRPGYSPSNPCAPPPEEATTALSAGNTYAFLSGAKYGS